MSKTNQVCICCEARDTCPHYDTRRTVCVPVKCTDWESLEPCGLPQPTPVRLVEPIKLSTDWQQVRIQAAIAAMQGMLANQAHHKAQVESGEPFGYFYAINAIMCADVLIAELKKGGQDESRD